MKEMRDDEIIFSTPERGGTEHRSISAHTPYSAEKIISHENGVEL